MPTVRSSRPTSAASSPTRARRERSGARDRLSPCSEGEMSLNELFRAPLLVTTCLAATTAGCVDIVATGVAGYTETEEKRFPVAGRPEVALSTFDGAIEVSTWDKPEVLVEVE